jgi:cobyrinic acid a,c-diamide synthase
MPKLGQQHFPERHLGLVPTAEHNWAKDSIETITRIAEKHIDLGAVADIAHKAPELRRQKTEDRRLRSEVRGQDAEIRIKQHAPRIGIIKDSAFQFYYPENINALNERGAEIVFLSPLKDQKLPELDTLYIGGGFPETHAEQLAKNKSFSRQLKAMVEEGLPIYAECGGLMYLGKELVLDGIPYQMAGVLPLVFDLYKRPQGHGYTIVTVQGENPYCPIGTEIRGHEFHYSRVKKWSGDVKDLVFRMKRGVGISRDRDGILYKNVLATYTHVHALGTPEWAEALVRNAIRYQKSKN